ncbi:Remorin family protein [Raphanus sativus]|nr:Remorin family protein [Raphanus sativus]
MLTLYSQESSSTEITTTTSTNDASDRRDETPPPSETVVRDIHAMTTTELPRPQQRGGHLSPTRSVNFSDGASSIGENFTTVSREFNALVPEEDTNPWAIVPDGYDNRAGSENIVTTTSSSGQNRMVTAASVQRVKRDEVEAKITAWQTAKLAKINNRFKRQEAFINGWLNEQVHKANSWMKKIERKLEERRAKAMEKTQNKVAKAQRKAEERRATAEAKRGTEVARVLEVSNLMRAVGRPPAKRSCFSIS